MGRTAARVRVLVVDDSPQVRRALVEALSADPGIEVVGSASDPYLARDRIVSLQPDVLVLDSELPQVSGVEFVRQLMPQYPLPVVLFGEAGPDGQHAILAALEAGAVDFVAGSGPGVSLTDPGRLLELRTKVKIAAIADLSRWRKPAPASSAPPVRPARRVVRPGLLARGEARQMIVIGASTGGTEAVHAVVSRYPADGPPVLVVQHMPGGFTRKFAERLDALCPMRVKEAASGDRIVPGQVLIAPGGLHMRVRRSGAGYEVDCRPGDKVSGHCPSVDVLMHSVAEQVGKGAVGLMLTGMGRDGTAGLLAMRRAGARTLAQDEASSVVFGMPKEAYAAGAAEALVALDRLAEQSLGLLGWIQTRAGKAAECADVG